MDVHLLISFILFMTIITLIDGRIAPYAGVLYYYETSICNGIVMTEEYVLAGNCTKGRDPTQFSFLSGTDDKKDDQGEETYISDVIVHPKTNISILKLSVALEFDNNTQPDTFLESLPESSKVNGILIYSEYMINGENDRYFHKAEAWLISSNECKHHFRNQSLPEGTFCVGTNSSKTIVNDTDCKGTIFAEQNGTCLGTCLTVIDTKFLLMANISYHIEWILSNIG